MAYQPYSPQIGCEYVLTSPNGYRVSFNDLTDTDYCGVLSEVTGLDSADVRESGADNVEADGGNHGAFYFGRRPMTFSGTVFNFGTPEIREARLDKLRRCLKDCLRGDGTLTWQNLPLASNPVMFTTFRMQQPLRVTGNWNKTFQFAIVSELAPLFSNTLNSSGAQASTASTSLENKGDYPAYPLVTITGAATNPAVSRDNTDVFTTTGLSMVAGDSVRFDMLNHTGVFTAGSRFLQSANRYIDFANAKFPYLPGATSSVWRMSGGNTMTVQWRDTWG